MITIRLNPEIISDRSLNSIKILLDSKELQPTDVYQDLESFIGFMKAHPEKLQFVLPTSKLPMDLEFGSDASDDIANTKYLFQKLRYLKPLEACDESLWFTLTLSCFNTYTAKRWPIPTSSEKQEDLFPKQMGHVRDHLFASSGRGFRRNQALSRLWFMGYVADSVDLDFDYALHTLLFNAEIASSFMDRVSVTQIPNFGRAILEVLHESHIDQHMAHTRIKHRSFLKELDLLSGRHSFAILNHSQSKSIVQQAFDLAYKD